MYVLLLYDLFPIYLSMKVDIWLTLFTGKGAGLDGGQVETRAVLFAKIMKVRVTLFSYY